MRKKRYTVAEHALARRLFCRAKSQGRLKPPRGLGALVTGNGQVRSYAVSSVSYRDYLADARRVLGGRPNRRRRTK